NASQGQNYDTVRMTGLILAIVMFSLGIIVALSKCSLSACNSPIGFISWLNDSLFSVIIKQYLYLIPTKI
uniref:FXYD domain-containing ion transport regulator n=1 Tax=Xenopus tropicalis TaxID=8364 RepID=A0A803JIK6_XENTR